MSLSPGMRWLIFNDSFLLPKEEQFKENREAGGPARRPLHCGAEERVMAVREVRSGCSQDTGFMSIFWTSEKRAHSCTE